VTKKEPTKTVHTSASSFADLLPMAQAEISKCTVELIRNEPFFGHILGGMQRHFTESVDTLAVGLRGDAIQLMVNPHFLLKELTKAENRVAVLKHEVLHIVFKHVFRNKSLSHDPLLWNLATDLVVNQYVAPYHLPEGAILLTTFPDLGLKPGDTADNYYAALKKLHDESNKSKKKTRGQGGADGSGQSKSPLSEKALEDIMGSRSPSDHTYWADSNSPDVDGEKTGSKISGAVRDAIEQVSEDQVLKSYERSKYSKTSGKIPGWLERYIGQLIEARKPKLNWRNTIRMFAASSRRSQMIVTAQRESKRFEALDGMPPNQGLKLKRFQNMAVAIDTSGSINDEAISSFFAEIHGMYKQGASITIVECDADIKRSYPYVGKIPSFVKGGGGTSFEPVMKWLKTKGQRFDGCVYLTDGFASAPETRPPCRLLWVLVGGPGGEHLKFGHQIVIQ
jgi:predicted metal-dependent peptidase